MIKFCPSLPTSFKPCDPKIVRLAALGALQGGSINPWAGIHPILRLEADYGVLTTGGLPAGFLDPVAAIINRGTASDATQDTSGSQGVYLPLINGKGYGFHPGVNLNFYTVDPDPVFDEVLDFTIEWEGYVAPITGSGYKTLFAQWGTGGTPFLFTLTKDVILFDSHQVSDGNKFVLYDNTVGGYRKFRFVRSGSVGRFYVDEGEGFSQAGSDQSLYSSTSSANDRIVEIGSNDAGGNALRGATAHVKFWRNDEPDDNDPDFHIDFTDPSIPDNAATFECVTGQEVTVHQSGVNPATLVRTPEIYTDGTDDFYTTDPIGGTNTFTRFWVGTPHAESDGVLLTNASGYAGPNPGASYISIMADGRIESAQNGGDGVTKYSTKNSTAVWRGKKIIVTQICNGVHADHVLRINGVDQPNNGGYANNPGVYVKPDTSYALGAYNSDIIHAAARHKAAFEVGSVLSMTRIIAIENYYRNKYGPF